jgi:hypothetical protein
MYLIQLLLPLEDNEGRSLQPQIGDVRQLMVDRFGGVTAFTRAPAEGIWENGTGKRERDEIVVLEVMLEQLERDWWGEFRELLEQRFGQEEIIIRCSQIERL